MICTLLNYARLHVIYAVKYIIVLKIKKVSIFKIYIIFANYHRVYFNTLTKGALLIQRLIKFAAPSVEKSINYFYTVATTITFGILAKSYNMAFLHYCKPNNTKKILNQCELGKPKIFTQECV